jgi:hypothetical protein
MDALESYDPERAFFERRAGPPGLSHRAAYDRAVRLMKARRHPGFARRRTGGGP